LLNIGTRKAINARLNKLARELAARKKELQVLAEDGSGQVDAKCLRFAVRQLDWVNGLIDALMENIGSKEVEEE
jgi:hypothetical protein